MLVSSGYWDNQCTTKSETCPSDTATTIYSCGDTGCVATARDTQPPSGSVLINSGSTYTKSISVTLSLSCSDNSGSCSKMRIANTFSGVSSATIRSFSTSTSWTLLSGDGTKAVYIKYQDNSGNWSNTFADTIVLDTTVPDKAPTVSISTDKSSYKIGENISIKVVGTDDIDVSSVQAYYNGSWHTTMCTGIQTTCTRFFTASESSAGSFTYTGNAWDNTGQGASPKTVSITIEQTAQCSAPINPTCSYNTIENTLNLQWNPVSNATTYKMEWARVDKSYGDSTDTLGGTSRIVSSTSSNTFGLKSSTLYKLRTRVETGSACTPPGLWSSDIECSTGSCSKTSSLPSKSASVSLPNGNCSLTITPIGFDRSDESSVSYEELSSATNSVRVGMDDNPVFGCENNLKWSTAWDRISGEYNYTVGVTNVDYDKKPTHDLGYGFEISSSQCVIKDFVDACSTGTCSYVFPEKVSDRKMKITSVYSEGKNLPYNNSGFGFNFEFVECTQNSHCTADVNKTTCNVGITTDLPQNTCINQDIEDAIVNLDTQAPVVSITAIEGWQKSNPSIAVGFTDNVSLNRAEYRVDKAIWKQNPDTEWQKTNEILNAITSISAKVSFSIDTRLWNNLADGTYTVSVRVFDDAGLRSSVESIEIKKDTKAPGIETQKLSLWYTTIPPQLFPVFSDNIELNSAQYRIGISGTWTIIPGFISNSSKSFSKLFRPDGSEDIKDWEKILDGIDRRIYIRACDSANNCTGYDNFKFFSVKKDITPPTIKLNKLIANSDPGAELKDKRLRWINDEGFTFTTSETDATSGLASCSYKLQSSTGAITNTFICNSTSLSVPIASACAIEGKGECILYITVIDKAGNPKTYKPIYLSIDRTSPR